MYNVIYVHISAAVHFCQTCTSDIVICTVVSIEVSGPGGLVPLQSNR